MKMTWKPTPTPDEEAFASIKAGIDALPPGVKMFLNSGELCPRRFIILTIAGPELARLCLLTATTAYFSRVLRTRLEHG